MQRKNKQLTEQVAVFSGALFLFGLYALFATHLIFPGILFLLWLISVPILLVEEGWMGVWISAQSTLWLLGLGFLLWAGILFPAVLLLAGFSALIVAVAPPDKVERHKFAWPFSMLVEQPEKQKAKRHLPMPEQDEPEESDEIEYYEEAGRRQQAGRS